MTPTGKSIDIEKLRKKLQEAKTIEERRLLQEALLSYVGFLREKLSRLESEVRSYLHALLVTLPLAAASLIVTAVAQLHGLKLLVTVLKLVFAIIVATGVTLLFMILLRRYESSNVEGEIYEIYDVVVDPVMRRGRKLIDETTIFAIVLVAIIVAMAIIAWVWF